MPGLIPYLESAAAHPDLKRDVLEFLGGGSGRRIELSARSGCSDFVGELTVHAGDATHRFAFTWCCAWRARELGWKDCFGFWDQTRAAREYGWRCFERWEPIEA
jgi:hypothetical protein